MHQSKKDRLLLFLAIALTDLILFKFILFPKYKSVLSKKRSVAQLKKDYFNAAWNSGDKGCTCGAK